MIFAQGLTNDTEKISKYTIFILNEEAYANVQLYLNYFFMILIVPPIRYIWPLWNALSKRHKELLKLLTFTQGDV